MNKKDMPSLTLVSLWKNNSWRLIKAQEATKSELFRCEHCGQRVILAHGEERKPYFKHLAAEADKSCPERTFGNNTEKYYESQVLDLPVRIVVNKNSAAFHFEVGLIRAPISSLDKNFSVIIKPQGLFGKTYYKERLNIDSITYISVGEIPCETYTLKFSRGNEALCEFWPKEIKGIDPHGTLFEKKTLTGDNHNFYGKKLPYDADVEIEKEYYLLRRGDCDFKKSNDPSIRFQEILQKQMPINGELWILKEISASTISKGASEFFLNYHCRLTDHPVSLQPIWPLFVKSNSVIKHNQDSMYVLAQGNVAAVKTFPPAVKIAQVNSNTSPQKLYKVPCTQNKQFVLSAGRTQALKYTYFWQEALNQENQEKWKNWLPEVSVTDLNNAEVAAGESFVLPPKNILRFSFKSPFFGELLTLNNDTNQVVDKQKIPARSNFKKDELAYGLSLQVIIGFDVIWQIDFKKPQPITSPDDSALLKYITSVSGITIPAPHSLRNMLVGMKDYPQIAQWIRQCIKSSTINEQAYRRLQQTFRSITVKR